MSAPAVVRCNALRFCTLRGRGGRRHPRNCPCAGWRRRGHFAGMESWRRAQKAKPHCAERRVHRCNALRFCTLRGYAAAAAGGIHATVRAQAGGCLGHFAAWRPGRRAQEAKPHCAGLRGHRHSGWVQLIHDTISRVWNRVLARECAHAGLRRPRHRFHLHRGFRIDLLHKRRCHRSPTPGASLDRAPCRASASDPRSRQLSGP